MPLEKSGKSDTVARMVVIRRLIDRQRAYTAIFLPGEEPKFIPTTDYEHGRIMQIYKQDRPYPDVLNDFTDFGIGEEENPSKTNGSVRTP